jgi:hypothetical protein
MYALTRRDIEVGVESRPWNGQPRNRGSIPKRQELFVRENLQTSAGGHKASYPIRSGAHSLELKRSKRQADHSPPPSTKVKNEWLYISSLMRLQGVRKDNFALY